MCVSGFCVFFKSARWGLSRWRSPAALAPPSQSTTRFSAHFSFNFNRLIPLLQHILIQLLVQRRVVLQPERQTPDVQFIFLCRAQTDARHSARERKRSSRNSLSMLREEPQWVIAAFWFLIATYWWFWAW